MFSNLAKLEVKRTGKEAVGFYIAYLFLGALIAFAFGVLFSVLFSDSSPEKITLGGQIIAIIICTYLALLISYKRSLFSSFNALLLIVTTVILSVLLGAFGGLVSVSVLTTLSNEKFEE